MSDSTDSFDSFVSNGSFNSLIPLIFSLLILTPLKNKKITYYWKLKTITLLLFVSYKKICTFAACILNVLLYGTSNN